MSATRSAVTKIIMHYLDAKEIEPEQTFGELGADSLDVVEISMAIETEFGLGDVDLSEHWGFDTPMSTVFADVEAAMAKQRVAA